MGKTLADVLKEDWSYSRLSSYRTCPLSFKMKYLDGEKETLTNVFSSTGSLVHNILEAFYKKEMKGCDMEEAFNEQFDWTARAPNKRMVDAYYISCLSYLRTLGNRFPEYYNGRNEIVSVERKIELDIQGIKFIGFVDLEMMIDGELATVDHKISRVFTGDTLKEKKRQLLLYSQANGANKLMYNFFHKKEVLELEATQEEKDEAMQWVVDTVEMIKKDKEFKAKKDSFFCKNICGLYSSCEAWK